MGDLPPLIETLEHRWMRAWVHGDRRTLKALTARNFRLLIGSKPGVILDAASWLDAATARWSCSSYRFGDIYVRPHGGHALFATQLELEAELDGKDWSGQVWLTDLWRKARFGRGWRMVERILSRTEDDPQVPAAIRSMQLWR